MMDNSIYFILREMGEIHALKTILELLSEQNSKTKVHIIPRPYNTDFRFIDFRKEFCSFKNAFLLYENHETILGNKFIYGFKGNICNSDDQFIQKYINIYEVSACRRVGRALSDNKKMNIVVGNLKIGDKDPAEEYSGDTWKILGLLPYSIYAFPRHPLINSSALHQILVSIPKNITFVNSMGLLEKYCSSANLTIMGKLFSNSKDDRDHNPLEATINSNTISGMYSYIPEPYKDLYNSGLITQINHYNEISDEVVHALMHDDNLKEKLIWRNNWISYNRQKYFNSWFV